MVFVIATTGRGYSERMAEAGDMETRLDTEDGRGKETLL